MWESHQRGSPPFFGFDADGAPRWVDVKVDAGEAMQASHDIIDAFFKWLAWPEAPPFSGGVLDAWPARMAQGLSFARREWAAVQAFVQAQSKQRTVTHG